MPRAEVSLDGVASVATLRAFVRRTLAAWRATGHEWAALTVATELATNAVLHAGTEYTVALVLDDAGTLSIEVGDGSPLSPTLRRYDGHATTGRGVALIAYMSTSWHVERTATGKVVSCQLAAPGSPEPSDEITPRVDAAPLQRPRADDDDTPNAVTGQDSA